MRPRWQPRRREWVILAAFALLAILVAVIAVTPTGHRGPRADPGPGRAALAALRVTDARLSAPGYQRTAFGAAWTDETDALYGHNGCDTRDDILARDLIVTRRVATQACDRAVAAGELRSPYTGERIAFRRGRETGSAVQIDHIVPLSYAWDMGAAAWDTATRMRFANDPANLVAVDGRSNQDKSDSPPARWMPERRAFACSYASQFAIVGAAYRLAVDKASVTVLRRALDRC